MGAVACALASSIAACGPDATTPLGRRSSRDDDTVRVDLVVDPPTIDPALVDDPGGRFLVRQLFDGLTEIDPATGEARPALAARWSASPDLLRWTFTLREDARWSNDKPVTADDVVFSFARALRPTTGSPKAYRLFPIKNARDFHRGALLVVRGVDVRPKRPPFVVFGDAGALEPPAQHVFPDGAVARAIDSNLRTPRRPSELVLRADPAAGSPFVAKIAAGARAVVLGRQAASSTSGEAWVQLRPPEGGQAGWARESDVDPAFPSVDLRRVVGDRRFSDRVPLLATAQGEGRALAQLEDDDEVEVLVEHAAHAKVLHVKSGRVGWVSRASIDDVVRERVWFLVEVEGPDGATASGWIPTEKLRLDAKLLGARALDARTVQIDLEEPSQLVPQLAATTAWRPVPRAVVERFGSAWTEPAHVAGSGAWRVVEHVPDARWVLAAAAGRRGTIARAVVEVLPDRAAAVNLYASGFLDALAPASLPRELAPALRALPDYREGRAVSTTFFVPNAARPPLDDPRVRRALSLALDREALIAAEGKGAMRAATSLVPPGVPGAAPFVALPASVAGFAGQALPLRGAPLTEARALLAAAGHADGARMRPLELIVVDERGEGPLAAAAARQWRERLGVPVVLVHRSARDAAATRATGAYDLARRTLVAEVLDPSTFLDVFMQDSGDDVGRWRSAAYEALLRGAAAETITERRAALLAEAETVLIDDGAVVPLGFFDDGALVAPHVRGLAPDLLDDRALARVRLGVVDDAEVPQ